MRRTRIYPTVVYTRIGDIYMFFVGMGKPWTKNVRDAMFFTDCLEANNVALYYLEAWDRIQVTGVRHFSLLVHP